MNRSICRHRKEYSFKTSTTITAITKKQKSSTDRNSDEEQAYGVGCYSSMALKHRCGRRSRRHRAPLPTRRTRGIRSGTWAPPSLPTPPVQARNQRRNRRKAVRIPPHVTAATRSGSTPKPSGLGFRAARQW